MYEKPVQHILSDTVRSIGLVLSKENFQAVANAVMKCSETAELVTDIVIRNLNAECEKLCSTSNKSILRMSAPEDLQKFDWNVLVCELKQKAPLFFAILMTVGAPPRPRNKRKGVTEDTRYPGVCTAAAILLKEQCDNMSALQHLVGVILFHGNASKQVHLEISITIYDLEIIFMYCRHKGASLIFKCVCLLYPHSTRWMHLLGILMHQF